MGMDRLRRPAEEEEVVARPVEKKRRVRSWKGRRLNDDQDWGVRDNAGQKGHGR
jgi:hypothetical protein